MHCFIVSYDLRQPGRDYDELYKALRSYPGWGRVTESTWAVVSEKSAKDIRDHLLSFLDNNDRIFVIKSGQYAAWQHAMADSDWLKKYLVL